jgi:transcriptional regulator with XRE-family HTH domain
LGAGLRYLRGQKKLTLLQVSKGAGLTLAVYHRIEMGQREVEEPVLEKIAHALGYSGSDLQLKIYELDISGALDELKQSDNKSGIENSKGGYNDLPVSRFMIKTTNAQEINVPIYGLPQEDGSIILDKEKSSGSILCPSTLANVPGVYGIRLLTKTLGTILPQRSVLIAAPGQKLKDGDIAVLPLEDDRIKLVSVCLSAEGIWSYTTADTNAEIPISFDTLSKMQRIVFIAIP